MVKEVRSSWSSDGKEPRRGYSPGAYSSPSNGKARADGGHAVRSPGKGPAVRRPDAVPVVGGEFSARLEQQLDGSMRNDSRRR